MNSLDVMQELAPIGKKFASGDLQAGVQPLQELWDRLPEPKVATPNAYLIIEYGVAFALKLGDLENAWTWADRALAFKEVRQDRGEVEFLVGKVAYEDGKLEMALTQFREATKKSKGRILLNEDPKYKALLQNKNS